MLSVSPRLYVALIAMAMLLLAPLSSPALAQSGSPPVSDAALAAKVADACKGASYIGDDAIMRADMDGDGRDDVLFDWGRVACATPVGVNGGAGFCGMHNCAIDVYLSSQYRPGGWPKPILHHRELTPQIVPGGAFPILRTAVSGGSCAFAQVCQRVWRWDGREMKAMEVPQGGAQPLVQRVPPTPADALAGVAGRGQGAAVATSPETVAGNWVEAGDGCATDTGVGLRSDGRYFGYEESGSWRLLGNRIAIMVRETYVMGDEGSNQVIRDPQPIIWTVLALTENSMRVRTPFAPSLELIRCP